MLWNIYLRKGMAFVPTVAQTEAGYYLNINPVEVIPAIDADGLRRAVEQVIGRGNPRVPTPTRAAFPKPVMLEYAKVKSWAAFEKDCINWNIVEKDGCYKITRGRKRPDRGWEDDPTQIDELPPGAGIDEVAQRVASLVHSAHRED
jgi:hypothetical protein